MDKDELSNTKTQLEIKRLSIDNTWVRVKNYIFVPIAFLSVIGAALEVYLSVDSYITQRKTEHEQRQIEHEQRVDQYRFDLTTKIVELTLQLSSDNPIQQRTAAVTLGLYGTDATEVLVANLGDTELRPYLVTALARIVSDAQASGDEANTVARELLLNAMLYYTNNAFEEAARSPYEDPGRIKNYVLAIKQLYRCSNNDRVVTALGDQLSKQDDWSTKARTVSLADEVSSTIKAVTEKCP